MEKKQEKKQKLNYEGPAIIRINCDCGAPINLLLKQGEISECGHCHKEMTTEINLIEMKKGSAKEKFIQKQQSIVKPSEIKHDVDTKKVRQIKEEERKRMGL